MKILTISNCPLESTQGSGYVILNHYDFFKSQGYAIDLFGPEQYKILKRVSWGNAYRITIGMFFLVLKLNIKKYDIIECWGGESWLAVWYLKLFHPRKKLIHKSNGIEAHVKTSLKKYQWDSPAKQKWYHMDTAALYRYAEVQADLMVTVSNFDRDFALQHAYQPAENVISVYPGLSELYRDLDVSFERLPVMGFCGSWINRKGIDIIKKDTFDLLKKYPQLSIVFIGVGEHIKKEEFFPGIDPGRIIIYSSVKNKAQLIEIYKTISIAFMPSYHESFGLVLAEAMACGCAVVTANTGYGYDLKHLEEAFVMKETKPGFLYEGIEYFINNSEERIRVAQNGYQKVQSLDWNFEPLNNRYKSFTK